MTDYKPRRSLARASLQLLRGDDSASNVPYPSHALLNDDIELQHGESKRGDDEESETEMLFERQEHDELGERGSGHPFTRASRQSASYSSSAPDQLDQRGVGAGDGGETTPFIFEAETPVERGWMWTSVGVVTALALVSIAISLDWIDWPGDGIGRT